MAQHRTHRLRLATDTATLAVFDPVRLRHRLGDSADWWTWPSAGVLADLNSGNMLAFDLGSDGVYSLTIHLDQDRPNADVLAVVSGLIGCDSGVLYIGPGEQISADGLEPDETLGGCRLPCPRGSYRAWFAGSGRELELWLEPISDSPVNQFTDYLRLPISGR